MLDETNCPLGSKSLFGNKEDLFNELKSLMPSVSIKAEVLTHEERIKSIEDMVNLGFLIKVDDASALCSDVMSSMTSKTKKSKKTGMASVLNEDSIIKQPSKGKIYGRRFNGRFASKAVYHKHQMNKNNVISEAVQNVQKSSKRGDLVVECGITWSRVDQVQMLKTLEALRLPDAPSWGSKTKIKTNFDEFSDIEPEPRHEVPYEYDKGLDPCPPLPPYFSDVKCGMDYCRLGCVCHSISGTQKKLLKRDHCSQYQCMFSCHCQHLTRSRATLFENLSPIMDSKFSFTKLNKSSFPTKKQLFSPRTSTNAEDSGDEIRRKDIENSKPQLPKKELTINRTPERIKDKNLYNSVVVLESVDAVSKATNGEEIVKQNKRKNKKSRTSDISENSLNTPKGATVTDYLEISSDSEDEAPITKRKKSEDSPISKSRCDGFEAPMLFPTGKFYMEHVLIKKRSELDGSRQDLLVESYHDFDWQYCKKSLSGFFHENTFTKTGINREKKNIEWSNFKIYMFPAKDKKSIPRNVLDKLETQDYEYIKAIVTKSNSIIKEAVEKSPIKSSEPKENKPISSIPPSTSNKCDDVIVVEDDSEEMSDSSDDPDIINKVGSLAPRLDSIQSSTSVSTTNNSFSPISSLPGVFSKSPREVLPLLLGNLSDSQAKTAPSTLPENIPKSPITDIVSQTEKIDHQTSPKINQPSPFDINSKPSSVGILPQLLNSVATSIPLKITAPANVNSVGLLPSPNLQVPFHNATGISGCRQFKFNTFQQVDSQKNKILPLRNSNLPNSTQIPKITAISNVNCIKTNVPIKDYFKNQLNDKQPTKNFVNILPRCMVQPLQPGSAKPRLNSIKILKMPSANISSSMPLSLTPMKYQSIITTSRSNNLVVHAPVKPPNTSETEGKKIIVLKHVPTTIPARLCTPGTLLLKSPISAVIPPVSLLPRLPVAVSLKQLTPENSKPNIVSSISKVDIKMPKPVEAGGSSTIEITDSDEEEKNKITDNLSKKDISYLTSDSNKDSTAFDHTNGCTDQDQAESNIDSKSVSSHSDSGVDKHQVCRKRLKMLYQEIVKMENIEEKRDKMSAGEILEMVLVAIKKLQDTNVELANLRFIESERRKKLANELRQVKGSAETP